MTAAFAPYSPVRYAYRRVRSAYTRTLAGQNIVVNGHHLAPGIRTSRQASQVLWVRSAPQLTVTVRNTGTRAAADVVQVYAAVPGVSARRLAGFAKTATLRPGARQTLSVALEPRLLARYDVTARRFTMPAGRYQLFVGRSATDLDPPQTVTLSAPRPLRH